MSKKKETSLQERIQKFIEGKGGYVVKNHGSMISEPGIADLTVCYKGWYIAIEVKVDKNTPSRDQGIHARKVLKAGGTSLVAWSIEDVQIMLNIIDAYCEGLNLKAIFDFVDNMMKLEKLDNGSKW